MKDIHNDTPEQTEDELQQKCYFWFHNRFPALRGLLFHVPNGGARNKREAGRFKQIGVVPGVSDFILLYNGRAHCIELKVKKRTQGEKQIKWQGKVEDNNIHYVVCGSLIEFKDCILAIVG